MLRWASTLWGGLGRRFMARKSPSGGGSSSASVDGAASGKEVFERVMGLERPGQAGVSPVQPEQAQRQREIALLYNQKRREQALLTQRNEKQRIQLMMEAIEALPPGMQVEARSPDTSPFPRNMYVPTHYPPAQPVYGQSSSTPVDTERQGLQEDKKTRSSFPRRRKR